MKHSIIGFFLLTILFVAGYGQQQATTKDTIQPSNIIIDQIVIVGNKKTKEHIIKRELTFSTGDTILSSDTNEVFTRSRNNTFNTNLFIHVKSDVYTQDSLHYIFILEVKERWYFWPVPILELADRNFNEWVQQRDADLTRINIGIDFRQENFRGRNEEVRIKLQTGFTKKYEVFYTIPYIDKKRKTGIKFLLSYSTNKIVAYQTSNNVLDYYDGEQIMKKRFYGGITLTRRSKLYSQHKINIKYRKHHILDTIRDLNPHYFLDGRTEQQYFELKYLFIHDKRDIKYYSLKGHFTEIELEKLGTGIYDNINQVGLYLTHARYYALSKKLFFGSRVKGKYSIPQQQPYFNNKALGYYEDFVRGYELYVVDGQKYALNRNELKFKLFDRISNLENYVGVSQFNTLPLQIYIKGHLDFGWADDNSYAYLNPLLNDNLMAGAGIGLDFVSFYDSVFRIEYSFNKMKEHGLFLHIWAAI